VVGKARAAMEGFARRGGYRREPVGSRQQIAESKRA